MPFINSKISVKVSESQREDIKSRLGEAIAILGKSEAWLMVGFQDDYCLYFKGEKFEKIAYVEVALFGKSTSEEYEKLTKEICNIYNEILQIPKDKIYVKYEEVNHWGWNGANF